jgi:hypothetical protein
MFEKGLCQKPKLPDSNLITPAGACLIDSEIAVDILQMMLKGDNIVAKLQAMAAEGDEAEDDTAAEEPGMTAAEASTLAGAAVYSLDSYRKGESVVILADYGDGQLNDTPVELAVGCIRAECAWGTAEVPFWEVSMPLLKANHSSSILMTSS